MSAPSSSAPRGTGPTSSQAVTASVIKFRCLYTHDLRRKSKRWQDGYLRYHAFNKRIMVYDEQGNYIGDHHWRSGEEVQDGDELELDKGALIQVGERMGTTQQDLSNLFEKKKASQGSPQANERACQTPRTSTPVRSSGSSQPFRSLNDLLGIKKTPIGRLVSPYEERNPPPPPSNTSESPGRAPKRQKVPLAERSSVDRRQAPAQVVDLTESAKVPSITSARNTVSTREIQKPPKDPHSSPLAPSRNKQSDVPKTTQPTTDSAPFAKPSLPPPLASSKRPPEPATHTPARESQPERIEPSERPNNALPPLSRPASGKPDPPTSTLRMSTEKPRRKLMYSALLPSEASQKSSPTPMPPPEKRSQPTPRAMDQPAATPAPEIESTNAEFMPSDSTQFILEEMADTPTIESISSRKPNPPAPPNLPVRRALDAPLRKSLSDPTALTARPALQNRPTLMRSAMSAVPEEPQTIEEGPWTSEALDLFEFWPPGRPKPC